MSRPGALFARDEGDIPELLAGPRGARYGLYVHCPFCVRRCPYCDFNVVIYREDRVPPLVQGLGGELERYAALPWAGHVPAESLFFGGGTPSLLPARDIGDVIAAARRGLGLVPGAEVTLEANPDGLDRERLTDLRAAGVTRLSLGVQSLDEPLLRRLGRAHDAETARHAFEAARAAGFEEISVDLLYACPGQDLTTWLRTLDEVLAWKPEHLSAYALTLEPGTAFGRRPPLDLPDEGTQVAQFHALCDRAAGSGLERYEVSNFARSGRRSRHNLLYWCREEYVGLGPGAHGALGPVRFANLRAHTRYGAAVAAGDWPIERWERLRDEQVTRERIMLGLRLVEGLAWNTVSAYLAQVPGRLRALEEYLAAGLLEARGGQLATTARGVLVLDTILANLA